jgi:hypothetical protein
MSSLGSSSTSALLPHGDGELGSICLACIPEQNSGHTTGEKAVTEFLYSETLTYSPPYWLASAQRWDGALSSVFG